MRISEYKKFNLTETTNLVKLSSLKTYHPSHDKRINLVKDKRSFQDNKGIWKVYPIGISDTQVHIVCPYCGEIHFHGRGKKPAFNYEGLRRPHCESKNENSDYYIMKHSK